MSYTATIIKLTNIRKHPNADRLQIAEGLGFSVIVDLDAREDMLWALFPSDGCLSREMCLNNNLYRKHPETGMEMSGYFEENGRVKSLRLRGAKSDAFVTPVSNLLWTGVKESELVEGYEFTELNGKKICEKYYTPATKRAMAQNQGGKKTLKVKDYCPDFAEHFSTTKLRHTVYNLVGRQSTLIITEKLHGTSGRTGYVRWTKKNLWQKVLSKIGLYKDGYKVVTGTRKVVLDPDKMGFENGFYAGTTFRKKIHDWIASVNLEKGEVIYYEIVGYTDNLTPIMGEHSLKGLKDAGVPKSEYLQYKNSLVYSYGCERDYTEPFKVYVYRIVKNGKDLSWSELKQRCGELNMEHVPELDKITLTGNESAREIMELAESYTVGDSVLDNRHFKEGVCIRIDTSREDGIPEIYKYKGDLFCILEGIQKNDPSYIDMEEIS